MTNFSFSGRQYNVKLVRDSISKWLLKDVIASYFHPPIPLPENPTIVDVGAHVGLFSILAYDLYNPKKFVSYEPNAEVFKILKENIAERQIDARAEAVSVFSGKTHFYTMKSDLGYTIVQKPQRKNFVDVEAITISEILHELKYIDLLKLDCEGAEFMILNSLLHYDAKHISHIICEFHKISGTFAEGSVTMWQYRRTLDYLKFIGYNIDTDLGITVGSRVFRATYIPDEAREQQMRKT